MATPSLIFSLVYALNFLVFPGAYGVSIELYKHDNFTGLVWQSNSRADCNNIPYDKITMIKSIRTDTCFIAYWNENCKSVRTEKYLPGDIILSSTHLEWIKSFQICNEQEVGNQLNVDITKYYAFGPPPEVLESYKNVCSCFNVPQYVQNMSVWSINNHHNELLAYHKPNCLENPWKPYFMRPGHYSDSNYIQSKYKFESFGPVPNATYYQTSCPFSHVTTESTVTNDSTTESVMDTPFDQSKQNEDIFQSEALMNSIKKLWSNSSPIDISELKSNLTSMSCFTD